MENYQLNTRSLLASSAMIRMENERKRQENPNYDLDRLEEEETQLMRQAQQSSVSALVSANERISGKLYKKRLEHTWKPPYPYNKMTENEDSLIRKKYMIEVQGSDIPPCIPNFKHMKLPIEIINELKKRNIFEPTPIQMQGLPAVFSGRDIIGIAFTGSGKTMVFVLPAVILSLEAELQLKFLPGEGPHALILAPSRELAHQTHNIVRAMVKAIAENRHYPSLETMCAIGGEPISDQTNHMRKRPVHIVVATPGRLKDLVVSKRMSMSTCMFLALDEADRLIGDEAFEEEIKDVVSQMSHQRQTVLFSATMPEKVHEFARTALVDPLVVNVGRAGVASLNVLQEIEYVPEEKQKLGRLLQCLRKTPPPVLIFCENKRDVDFVNEYLLIKGVSSVCIHSGLTQSERLNSIERFRSKRADVLIGTDVASKGLDFATTSILHVINYDLPREIENYVHRIGRTGRAGNLGVATTLIDRSTDVNALKDLRALLLESKQPVPQYLNSLVGADAHLSMLEVGGVRGCRYCGALGHRIKECPKIPLAASQNRPSYTDKRFDFE